MTTARGYKSTCLLDYETAYNADPTTKVGRRMPINENRLKGSRNKNRPDTIAGTRNPVAPFDDRLDVSGDLIVPVDSTAFAFWLIAMFRAPTTTIVGEGPTYKHVFKVGDIQPSFVVERAFANAAGPLTWIHHNGCKVASWSMDLSGEGELVSTLNVKAGQETKATAVYVAEPVAIALTRLHKKNITLEEGDSPIAIVTALDFSLDFGLDDDTYVVGSDIRGDLVEGIIGVSGNLTALFQSTALMDKALGSTKSSLKIKIESGAHKLHIHIPELEYAQNTPELTGPQGVRISLPFQAYLDTGADESAIVVELTNENNGTDYDLFS